MPNPTAAITGMSVISGIAAADAQKEAARTAADAQVKSAQMGVDEQRRQFDMVQEILSPYVQAGNQAITRQGDIAGIGGPEAQQAIIENIQNSPLFQAQIEQGENALLQNASATGGLRGGNVQGALAQFNMSALSDTINAEYSRLAQLTGIGQASAAGVGAAGQASANQISGLYGQQGAAQAGSAIAQGQATADLYGNLNQTFGYAVNEWQNKGSF